MYAYAITSSRDLRALRDAEDPDIKFEIIRKGRLTQSFIYRLQTPASACQSGEFKYVQIGDSFLCYQPAGYYDHACIDEGLLFLTPRNYDNALISLPSRGEVISNVVFSVREKTVAPLEQAEFYGAPVDIVGEVAGHAWNLWQY